MRSIAYIIGAVVIVGMVFSAIIAPPEIDFTMDPLDWRFSYPTSYYESNVDLANPERGFFTQYTYRPEDHRDDPLDPADLQKDRSNKITLVFRFYYLGGEVPPDHATTQPTPLSTVIDTLEKDLNTIRDTGQKVILRFAYQSTKKIRPCAIEHEEDPGKDWVLHHINQIGPILAANSDIIAVVQAGFIGTWGEWAFVNPDFGTIDIDADCLEVQPLSIGDYPRGCESDFTYFTDEFDANGDRKKESCECTKATGNTDYPLRERCSTIRSSSSSSNRSYNYPNRKEVTDALLSWLPDNRTIQLRTPRYKNEMYKNNGTIGQNGRPVLADAITMSDAFATPRNYAARIGHHNDCFLASDTDYSTYSREGVEREREKDYVAQETQYLPMGGETCRHFSPRSCCASAEQELARLHWSFLKGEQSRDCVFKTWGKKWPNQDEEDEALEGCNEDGTWPSDCGGDCYYQIKKKLGYRFQLLSGVYSSSAATGTDYNISIDLRNVGYAAPFNPRDLNLIFRHENSPDIQYAVSLEEDYDPRKWLPGTDHTIDPAICLPDDMRAGDYRLFLHLPDPEQRLKDDPRYAIKLANRSGLFSDADEESDLIWEASTGYNDLLKSVEITNSSQPNACSSGAARLVRFP